MSAVITEGDLIRSKNSPTSPSKDVLHTKPKTHTQRLASEFPPPLRTVFPAFELEDHPVDQRRAIKAIVTGAGISGVTAGILLPAKVPGLDLVIYERASDVVCERSPPTRYTF